MCVCESDPSFSLSTNDPLSMLLFHPNVDQISDKNGRWWMIYMCHHVHVAFGIMQFVLYDHHHHHWPLTACAIFFLVQQLTLYNWMVVFCGDIQPRPRSNDPSVMIFQLLPLSKRAHKWWWWSLANQMEFVVLLRTQRNDWIKTQKWPVAWFLIWWLLSPVIYIIKLSKGGVYRCRSISV